MENEIKRIDKVYIMETKMSHTGMDSFMNTCGARMTIPSLNFTVLLANSELPEWLSGHGADVELEIWRDDRYEDSCGLTFFFEADTPKEAMKIRDYYHNYVIQYTIAPFELHYCGFNKANELDT